LGAALRLASQLSRNEPGAAAEGTPAGRWAAAGRAGPAANGLPAPSDGFTDSLVARRSLISAATVARGRPYFAAVSCLSASANCDFGLPRGCKAAMQKGWVGTPLIKVRTIAL